MTLTPNRLAVLKALQAYQDSSKTKYGGSYGLTAQEIQERSRVPLPSVYLVLRHMLRDSIISERWSQRGHRSCRVFQMTQLGSLAFQLRSEERMIYRKRSGTDA